MPSLVWTTLPLFAVFGVGLGQQTMAPPSNPKKASAKTARPSAAPKAAQPKPPQPKYLEIPFDLTQTNLTANFRGHDIVAAMNAVEKAPALQQKSEFESTAAFETRRSGFAAQILLGSVPSTGELAFVVEDPVLPLGFKYDADSQTLEVSLMGRTRKFLLDQDQAEKDVIRVRSTEQDRDRYVGGNAFGATVTVDRTHTEEFGVAFDTDSWLFRSSPVLRTFTYALPMPPEEAKVLKPDIKVVLICRLVAPWFRRDFRGHEPTISEPFETIVSAHYLEVVPEQLWVFNSRTGDVVAKLSASSTSPK